MQQQKRKILISLWLSVAILNVACTRSCGKKAEQKPLTVDISTPVESLDPRYTTSATAARIAALVYGKLFELGDDLLPTPLLAESLKESEDNTFVLTLRKNLRFHDGSPLTASDVVYTFDTLSSVDVASPHGVKFEYLKSIKAIDDNTVAFELKQAYAPFLTDLCAIGIVSKKACEGRSQQCRHEYMGSGPYRLKSFDTAKEAVHLEPFADWFEGPPKNELLFRVVRDENTRILELKALKADLVDGDISPNNLKALDQEKHLTVREMPGLGYTYLAINVRGPKTDEDIHTPQNKTRLALANKDVRKAISHAIDFDQIIDKLLLGKAKRVSGLIPNGHWAKDVNLKLPAFDPALAERLLDQAGFPRKENESRFKLTISTTPNRVRQSIAELYVDYLKRIGIDASIRVKDFSALFQDMKQGQFEMFSAIWVPVTEPDLYYFVHHSHSIPNGENGGGNRHGYSNHEVDRLIDMGRSTIDKSKRVEIYQEIERKMIEDLPYIPLWNEDRIVIFNAQRLGNYVPSITGSYLPLRNVKVNS